MKLYTIYYAGRCEDSSVPLPAAPRDGMLKAVCENFGDDTFVAVRAGDRLVWRQVEADRSTGTFPARPEFPLSPLAGR